MQIEAKKEVKESVREWNKKLSYMLNATLIIRIRQIHVAINLNII